MYNSPVLLIMSRSVVHVCSLYSSVCTAELQCLPSEPRAQLSSGWWQTEGENQTKYLTFQCRQWQGEQLPVIQ